MKVTLAARPPLSASPQSLGFGSLELKSWLLELQSSSPRADRLVPVMKATQ